MEPVKPEDLKQLNDLQPNKKNPRRISKEDFAALQQSIKRFGDLSCVVFNIRSQQLVGGHQRLEAFKTNPQQKHIQILERYATPNAQGTIAVGKIWIDNEDYKYREVDWDEGTEKAANIAANRIQGEFDLDLLAQMNYELSQLENGSDLLMATGQDETELKKLMKSIGVEEPGAEDELLPEGKSDKLEFRLTREQREVVEEAIRDIVATHEMAAEENGSKNGSALYYMSRDYLNRLQVGEPVQNENPAPAV